MQQNVEKSLLNVEIILENLKFLLKAKNNSDLGDFFGVKEGTISAWKNRNTMDFALLIYLCRQNGWNIEDIVFGSASKSTKRREMNEDILLKLLKTKDDDIKMLSQEIGSLREKVRNLKKQIGYTHSDIAAES